MLFRGIGIGIGFGLLLSCRLLAADAVTSIDCLHNPAVVSRSSNYLAVMTMLPTPALVPVAGSGKSRFILGSQLFAEMLGVSPKSVILNELEELRFISQTLAGTPLLLVLNSADDWTLAKAKKVSSVARMIGISISLVWLNESAIPETLQMLITDTKGLSWRQSELTRTVLAKTCLQVSL